MADNREREREIYLFSVGDFTSSELSGDRCFGKNLAIRAPHMEITLADTTEAHVEKAWLKHDDLIWVPFKYQDPVYSLWEGTDLYAWGEIIQYSGLLDRGTAIQLYMHGKEDYALLEAILDQTAKANFDVALASLIEDGDIRRIVRLVCMTDNALIKRMSHETVISIGKMMQSKELTTYEKQMFFETIRRYKGEGESFGALFSSLLSLEKP